MNELVYQRLTENAWMIENLAKYNGKPAVFLRNAPKDSDELWEGDIYPRIVYDLLIQSDPKGDITGRLAIRMFCKPDQIAVWENFERELISLFHHCFFSFDNMTIGIKWLRSKTIKPEIGEDSKGYLVCFQPGAFFKQDAGNSDIVAVFQKWLKELNDQIRIPGMENTGPTWKATDENPAVYCRLGNILPGTYNDTWEVSWLTATVKIHVIARRRKSIELIRSICEQLNLKDKLKMSDGGMFFIDSVTFKDNADSFKDGQILVKGQYGVQKKEEEVSKIKDVNFKEDQNAKNDL